MHKTRHERTPLKLSHHPPTPPLHAAVVLSRTGVFVGGDAWYCCLDHPAVSLRSKLRLSYPLERGKSPTREDTERLVDHVYELLKQEPSAAPTLLTYKPTCSPDDVWNLASILLETHRVSEGVWFVAVFFFWGIFFVHSCGISVVFVLNNWRDRNGGGEGGVGELLLLRQAG